MSMIYFVPVILFCLSGVGVTDFELYSSYGLQALSGALFEDNNCEVTQTCPHQIVVIHYFLFLYFPILASFW